MENHLNGRDYSKQKMWVLMKNIVSPNSGLTEAQLLIMESVH